MRNLSALSVFWVRLLSLFIIAALSQFLSRTDMMLATAALLFAHYPLSFFFSFRKMSQVTRRWRIWRPLIFITCLILVLWYFDPFNWTLYFGIHYALTEAFILPDETTPNKNMSYFPSGFLEELLRVGFHFSVFCYAIRSSMNFNWPHSPWLIAIAGITFFSLCWFFPKKQNGIHLGFGWMPLLISLFIPVHFYHILMYHVLIWILFPVVSQVKFEPKRIGMHLVSNAGLTLIFLFLLFIWMDPFRYENWEFCQPFLLAGTYFHLTSSLVLSAQNPLWIRKLFS